MADNLKLVNTSHLQEMADTLRISAEGIKPFKTVLYPSNMFDLLDEIADRAWELKRLLGLRKE